MNHTAAIPLTPTEFNTNLLRCWRRLQSGRKIAVHRSIIKITGEDVKSAIFLSQLLYWLRVGTDVVGRDGWVFKSIQETELETGLTIREQRSCKDHLKSLGFIESGYFGQGKKLAFRVNLEAISRAVCDLFNLSDITLLTLEDWRKQELSFIRDYFSDTVVYHLDLVRLTGDIYIAIMLSTALYHSARHGTPGTRTFTRQRLYYTATIDQWQQETFLGRKTQERARYFLRTHSLISEAHYFQNSRIFTHPNSHTLMSLLDQNIRLGKVRRPIKNKPVQQSLLDEAAENQNPADLESDKTDISDMSNRASDNKDILHNSLSESITTTTNTEAAETSAENVVVVSDSDNHTDSRQGGGGVKFEPYGKYGKLVFPPMIKESDLPQAVVIFKKHYPDASADTLQEILDELGGHGSDVRNPLSFLYGITKNAAQGNFMPLRAQAYKKQRLHAAKLQEKMREVQQENETSVTEKLSPEERKAKLLQYQQDRRAAMRRKSEKPSDRN